MGAARAAFMLPENLPREHSKPRASGIGSCARQQAYSMAGVAEDNGQNNAGNPDGEITSEQGRIVDAEITQKLIKATGFKVVKSQISLPKTFPMTGHPDGELDGTSDGLHWGYEHKQLGRWGYETVFKKGFEQGEPGYLCQTVSYGMALGWDAVYIVCMAQDASSTRSDARTNLKSKNPAVRWANSPDWNPKYLTYGLDLRSYYGTLGRRLVQRAEWLTSWFESSKNPADVAREADPTNSNREEYLVDAEGNIERLTGPDFPCGWCPWLAACLAAGDSGDRAPELPFNIHEEVE